MHHKTNLLAVLCLVALLGGCSPARMIEARDLLQDVAAGAGPSALKEDTETPVRRSIAYRVEDRQHRGDLYRPGTGEPEVALVLVPGVSPQGVDDPRLVAFANSLARVRFEVLVPDIANLRALRVGPGDAEPIADAVRALTGEGSPSGTTGGHRQAGIVAVSYAAGPAVLAALEPDLRGRVDFLLLIGGYHDIEAVVTYFTTGRYRRGPGEPWRRGDPDPRAKWQFLESNLALIEDAADREVLAGIARRKLRNPGADISAQTAALGPEGASVIVLLTNRDPDAVPALMADLPERLLSDFRGLDLSERDLSKLETELLLIHGRDDPVIPFTESQRLAEAASNAEVDLTLLDHLPHVDLAEPGADDALRLWSAAYDLLRQRDEAAANR